MAVYTRYAKVLDAEGKPLSVREALALINQTLDEALAEQEGDFDADSRWALTWFEQSGFVEGEYGVAEQLSKSKNTSVAGMVEAGILESKRGRVRLLKPDELPADWDPATDPRLSAWETVHHLIRALEAGGENAAAELVAKLGARPRSRASWRTASTRCASARSARPRRSPTTPSSRAGPRSPASPSRAVTPGPSKRCSQRSES
jgi:putative DNA methylase